MSAGTISIQNGSMTVQGVGTKFTQDLKVGDYIVFKAGNTSYTIPVATIASDTALTTVFAHDGPNTTGAAWAALPAATQLMINATLHANMSRLMRIYGYDSDNWNKLLTVDDDVTIVNPDNSEYSGPSWLKIAKLAANADFEAFQELAEQMHTEAQQVTTDKNTVVEKADAVESARSEVAANTAQVAQDKQQVSTDATESAANAAAAAQSAAEAAQYDPTKSVTLRGEIPVEDDLNSYVPNTTYRGVWYSLGGTLAKNFPVDNFVGTVEIFMVDSSGVQRATHSNGQQYFRWYTTAAYGVWVPFALGGANSTITSLTGLAGSLRLGGDGSNPNDAVTVRQMQQAIAAVSSAGGVNGVMSTFIGDVSWWQGNASLLPTGYVNPTGQLSLRSDFPEIWALVDAGALISTTEANWNSTTNLGYRGMFTKGTVTTGANANFRWPDLNGATTNAIQGLFLRGAATGKQSGEIRASAIPNLTGEAAINLPGVANIAVQPGSGGVFMDRTQVSNNLQTASGIQASGSGNTGIKLDASRVSNVYQNSIDEVRPPSVSGLWIMRAKGTFSAQTSFGVFTSQATAPAAGAVAYGGDIASVLQVGGNDYFRASLRTQVIGGGEKSLRLRLIDSASGTSDEIKVARTSVTLPEAGGTGSNNNRNGGNFRSETAQSYGQLRAYRNNADGGLVFQVSQDGGDAKNFYMTGLGNFTLTGAVNPGSVNANGTVLSYIAVSGSPANGSFLNAPGFVSRLDGRCYAVMYGQENVGVSHQIILNLNGFNSNYDWRFVAGGRIDTPLGVVATQGSDVRLKNQIEQATPGHTERISKVGVVEFTMKGTGERERGFIAQQLDMIDKMYTFESQITQSIRDEETGEITSSDSKPIMNVRDRALMADLIATVQDLLKEVADLKEEVSALKANK